MEYPLFLCPKKDLTKYHCLFSLSYVLIRAMDPETND
jgi:hypothetical protein